MDGAVLGATGDVGRQVVTQLVERRILPTTSRLQLVGRPDGASGRAVHGLRADLVDAYDEHAPLIDVAHSPADVAADVVVVAAGATTPPRSGASLDRTGLAIGNRAVFAGYADAIARHGSGHEVVIVVSNPVEVGVAVMAEALGARRVIGMGAWLDTLRFRREIAVELGVRRHRVGGFVGGQHGEDAVPLWSTVRLSGLDVAERARAVRLLRRGRTLDGFPAEVAAAKAQLVEVAATDVGAAYRLIDTWPADLRVVARPWMTHQSGAKTATATASATVDLVEVVLDGREIVVAGQVALDGEVSLAGRPLHGVLGVPLVLGPEGWTRVLLDALPDDETRRLQGAAAAVGSALRTAGVGRADGVARGRRDRCRPCGRPGSRGADGSPRVAGWRRGRRARRARALLGRPGRGRAPRGHPHGARGRLLDPGRELRAPRDGGRRGRRRRRHDPRRLPGQRPPRPGARTRGGAPRDGALRGRAGGPGAGDGLPARPAARPGPGDGAPNP